MSPSAQLTVKAIVGSIAIRSIDRSGNETKYGVEFQLLNNCLENCAVLWERSFLTLGIGRIQR